MSMVALLLGMAATSCSKEGSATRQEITQNFKALVMGGKDIDPGHTWSTTTSIPVKVSVSLTAGTEYRVYLFLSNPATESGARYAASAVLRSGESKTVFVNAPTGSTQLYATCTDGSGQAICLPVSGTEVSFSGSLVSSPGTPASTSGNNWSVPLRSMPSTYLYTSGTMVAPTEVDPELPEDAELRIQIGNDYSGVVPNLNTHTNLSIYVTGTWNLTFDQRIVNGNVLVVGNGGKVVIPRGFRLSTTPQFDEDVPGMIYVLPGGEITGEGVLELSDGSNTYSYNAGTITTSQVTLNSGTLYNAGTIGGSPSGTALYGEAATGSTPGQFFNYGEATFTQAGGPALSLLNASTIRVSSTLALSSSSRLDDGAVIECGSLALNGSTATSNVLYLGNGAFVNCQGAVSISHFGAWGPSGSSYRANALLSIGSCTACDITAGTASNYLLDHVQLQLPDNFSGFSLINGWINGNGEIATSRQTCFFAFQQTETPDYGGMYYAFEFPGEEAVKDFDYNDLILYVSSPYDNGDGTYSCFVNVAAVGTTMNTYLYYNGEQMGDEMHKQMSTATNKTVNTKSMTDQPRYIGKLTFTSPAIDLGTLPFSLHIARSDGNFSQTLSQGSSDQAPLYFAVNADAKGKWRWCREGTNIGLAFQQFSTWAANHEAATDWYKSTNASSSQIIDDWNW